MYLKLIDTWIDLKDISHINVNTLTCATDGKDFTGIPKSVKTLEIYGDMLTSFKGLENTKLQYLRVRGARNIESFKYLPKTLKNLIMPDGKYINYNTIYNQTKQYGF